MPHIASPTVLVFDSGLGGVTVYREIARARPDARLIYVADDAAFPYGDLAENKLVGRVLKVVGDAAERCDPDLVVIACNTASTLALGDLRARFSVPFVGTVPAIKPACAQSQSKHVAVLGTQATVSREYTRALIREFAAGCKVTLVGSARLATLAEADLNGRPPADEDIAAEIAPCFVLDGNRRVDTVVLACTHYPLLLGRLRANAPWPVDWIDPAPAIARRVVDLLGPTVPGRAAVPAQMLFTSGRLPPIALTTALKAYGFNFL
ncbi:MAG TPA: glutamate racemase [Pseudolabrys sp.]|nr:glutamate racemase [Pseudolabrys sp.]